jgi:hypothetical protein
MLIKDKFILSDLMASTFLSEPKQVIAPLASL